MNKLEELIQILENHKSINEHAFASAQHAAEAAKARLVEIEDALQRAKEALAEAKAEAKSNGGGGK